MSYELRTIDEVCVLVTDGTHYSPLDMGEGIPFLTVKDMNGNGLDFIGCSKITEDEYQRALSGNSAPQINDILFSKDGTVGKVHVVSENRPFAVLSSIAILRPDINIIDANYFGHILKMPNTLDQASRKKTGSALRRIILKDLKGVEIPLPPLAEQQRIAAILDKADALRAKRRAALAKLDTLLQSTFLHLFGDPVTNPMGWPEYGLLDVVDEFQNGIGKNKEYYGSGTKVANIGDLYRWHSFEPKEYSLLQVTEKEIARSTLERGDLLFVRSSVKREGVAYCSMYASDELCLFSSFMIRAKVSKQFAVPEFLAYLLRTPPMRLQLINASNTGTITNISQGGLSSVKFAMPPKTLQTDFIERVHQIEKQIVKMDSYLQQLDNLFHSLQQRAFKGEL